MDIELIKQEITYRTSRSGGKGGQNVNKVETKVEALLDIPGSGALSEEEKELLLQKLAGQLNEGAVLAVTNQTERSQLGNKSLAQSKLIDRLQVALRPVKKRKKTKMPARIVEARRAAKKLQSEKKATRRRVDFE